MLTIYINYTTEYGEAPSQVPVSIEDETEFTFTEEHLPELTADGYQFDGWTLDGSLIRVGDVSNIISIDTTFELVAHWTQERNYWGNATGGFGFPKTYIITDSDGNEFTGVYVESETIFTATDNDVRKGRVYASDNGVSTGTKDIPAYHTFEGYRVVTNGSVLSIPNLAPEIDSYDYTKLQALVCVFNTNITDSVSTEKVVINGNVYNVQSIDAISSIIKNHEEKKINLGITNESGNVWVLRYFMYKEIQ